MKARYVIGCTIITLLSVVGLANYYFETAPTTTTTKTDVAKVASGTTLKVTNNSMFQKKSP